MAQKKRTAVEAEEQLSWLRGSQADLRGRQVEA